MICSSKRSPSQLASLAVEVIRSLDRQAGGVSASALIHALIAKDVTRRDAELAIQTALDSGRIGVGTKMRLSEIAERVAA